MESGRLLPISDASLMSNDYIVLGKGDVKNLEDRPHQDGSLKPDGLFGIGVTAENISFIKVVG